MNEIEQALSWINDTEGPQKPADALQSGGAGRHIGQHGNEPRNEEEGLMKLQRKVDQRQTEKAEIAAIYKRYNDNIRACNMLQTEIAKGLDAGENIYVLFLKAVDALSRTVSDPGYYHQIEAKVRAVYAEGLGEPGALAVELEQTRQRLARLIEAEQRAQEPNDIERIRRAIAAHKLSVKDIENRMK